MFGQRCRICCRNAVPGASSTLQPNNFGGLSRGSSTTHHRSTNSNALQSHNHQRLFGFGSHSGASDKWDAPNSQRYGRWHFLGSFFPSCDSKCCSGWSFSFFGLTASTELANPIMTNPFVNRHTIGNGFVLRSCTDHVKLLERTYLN